jgi:hypothetical protein
MLKDTDDLLLVKLRSKEGGPLALREPRPAEVAIEHPALVILAVTVADRKVAFTTQTVPRAVGVLAAESG